MGTIVALSNTYGLVIIIFLLGYGLVELPKQMWMVSLSHFQITSLHSPPHHRVTPPRQVDLPFWL